MSELRRADSSATVPVSDKPASEATEPQRCVEGALEIAARLGKMAQWAGPSCCWDIVTADPERPNAGVSVRIPAGPNLYQGTAGIAVFLAELYGVTSDQNARTLAQGALHHSLQLAEAAPSNAFGFHSGRVGVAYAAARMAAITGDAEYADAARRVLEPLYGHEAEDRGLDVIGGAAGAIPVLLFLAEQLDQPPARSSAIALGGTVVRAANRGPMGWSWRGALSQVRDLLGLAHGASGYAHALLELAITTESDAFFYAAMQALSYERSFFDATEANWPDFRHHKLGTVLQETKGLTALRERLRSGEAIPPYEYRCISTWCHGAPGIGLVRARAYEMLGNETFAGETTIAADTTLASISGKSCNHSLCHGSFGNCEALLAASRALKTPKWADEARRFSDDVLEGVQEGRVHWRSGAIGGSSDPSLLLGEAGIGLFLLRLAVPSIPSVLLPVSARPSSWIALQEQRDISLGLVGKESEELFQQDIARFFARTTGVFARAQPEQALLPAARRRAAERGEALLLALRRVVADRMGSESNPETAQRLRDAAEAETLRFDESLGLCDQTAHQLTHLARPSVADLDWDSCSFVMSDGTTLLEGRWDWEAYIAGHALEPDEVPTFHVIYSKGGYIHSRTVGPLLALILSAANEPAALDTILVKVHQQLAKREGITGDQWPFDDPSSREKVKSQIALAYSAGLLDTSTSPITLTEAACFPS